GRKSSDVPEDCPSVRRRTECSWLFAGNSEYPAVLLHCHTPSIGSDGGKSKSVRCGQSAGKARGRAVGCRLRRRRGLLFDLGSTQPELQARLASPARVLCDSGGVLPAGARTPHRGVRVREGDREHPPRQPSGTAPPLLREAAIGSRGDRGAVLRRTSTENREAVRLRVVRHCSPDDGGGGAHHAGRTGGDCPDHRADESSAAVSIPGILRGHTPANSHDNELKIWS